MELPINFSGLRTVWGLNLVYSEAWSKIPMFSLGDSPAPAQYVLVLPPATSLPMIVQDLSGILNGRDTYRTDTGRAIVPLA